MAIYQFTAKDPSGKTLKGEVEAIDEKALIKTLQEEHLIPLSVKSRNAPKTNKKGGGFSFFSKVPDNEKVNFTRQLSTMISAGLPLTDALVILEKQTKNKNFEGILAEVVADVEGGMALSVAFAKHRDVFDQVYIKLIEAGETGGVLDKVLSKLADSMEKEKDFKSKTKGAFIYPGIVVTVMVAVMFAMMIFVIPRLTSLYTEMGANLPLPTKILIALSGFTQNFWWLIIFGTIGGIYGLRVYSRTPNGSEVMSKVIMKLPIWGKIKRMTSLAEFTRTLGLLIGTGIPIIAALKVVCDILESATYKEGLQMAITRVERGSPLYQPLAANPAFPPIVSQMIRVGEETGRLDEILGRLSIYFETESETLIRNLTTALEPFILVVLGLSVGALVLSIIMPIYNLTSQF